MLGSVFSSKLKESGAALKESGLAEMRAAKVIGDGEVAENIASADPARLSTEGKSQGLVGRILGCEGMKDRGEMKVKSAEDKMDS